MSGSAQPGPGQLTPDDDAAGAIPARRAPNPYIGPRAFRPEETLFGRERELRELLYLLVAERIVLLYAPSGAGKTSLIRAALIPALTRKRFRVLPLIRVKQELPADAPLGANRFLYSTLIALEEGRPEDQQLPQADLLTLDLAGYLRRQAPADTNADETVLIFDQFEEALTVEPADVAAKQAFFEHLGAALENRRVWALFAMREDHLAELDPFLRPIPNRFKDTFRLNLLGPAAARRAIQEPARASGVAFADAAAERLVDDLRRTAKQRADGVREEILGPYVEPVQLQVVCLRLWEKLFGQSSERAESTITLDDIEDVGDVDSALASYYVDRVRSVAAAMDVKERAIRDWFDQQLITPDGQRGQVLRQPSSSAGLDNLVIDMLIDAHLVRAEPHRGTIWFELAHDRLIAPIQRDNAAWNEANLSTLQRQAALWERDHRRDGLLLQSDALTEAQDWAAAHAEEMSSTEKDFFQRCLDARAAQEQKDLANQRIRRLLAATVLFAVVAIALAALAFIQYTRATQLTRIARVRQFAAQALEERNRSPQKSLLLALEAITTTQTYQLGQSEAEESLRKTLATAGGIPLRGHTAAIRGVAFSPDDRWLATISDESSARLWLVEAPQHAAAALRGHTAEILALAFSPDSRWLATASEDTTTRLWRVDAPNQAPVVLAGHTMGVLAVAWSLDGRELATGSADGTARLWDLSASPPISITLKGHGAPITEVVWSPDGRWLATSSSDTTARLWPIDARGQLDTTQREVVLGGHSAGVTALAFSPDSGQIITTSDDGTARLWAVDAPQNPLFELTGHSGPVVAVAFSPGGELLATGSRDGTARLWDLNVTPPTSIELKDHEQAIVALAFSPDGRRLVTGSDDGTARLWEVDAPQHAPAVLRGHEGGITAVAFNRDGRHLATASADAMARLWRIDQLQGDPTILNGHTDAVRALAFSHNGSWLATASSDATARLWPVDQPARAPIELKGHGAQVVAVAFSPDDRWLATGSWDSTARLWDLAATSPMSIELKAHTQAVVTLAFSSNDRWLATASDDGTARLWDLNSTPPTSITLTGHTRAVAVLAFSHNGRWLATGSWDGTARLWDLAATSPTSIELKDQTQDQDQNKAMVALAFSPNDQWLATASNDGTARLWRIDMPQQAPIVLKGHRQAITALAFSPDGQQIATGSRDGTARLWLTATPERDPAVLRGHEKPVLTLAFSPDGHQLATGSEDSTARIWSVDAPERRPVVLSEHSDVVTAVAFSDDGRWLATASSDKTARLWHTQLGDLVDLACATVGRNLSLDEWQLLISEAGASYRTTCAAQPAHPSRYQDLLVRNQIDEALQEYGLDLERDPTLDPPAAWLVQQAADMLSQGRKEPALAAYARARQLDSALSSVNVAALNQLCIAGDAPRYLAAALSACERAVELAPDNGNLHYNRGLVRGRAGDLPGAIADFQFFINWGSGRPNFQQTQKYAEDWIAAMQQGKNPFVETTPTPAQP